MSELTGFRKPNLSKLKEMIVYFAHEIPSYKTKMNKLLFYADFAYFREYGLGEPISCGTDCTFLEKSASQK